jgi:hypothetical protein
MMEARLLRDRGGLDPHQVSWLEETYAWFNTNLPCPPSSSSNWPKDAVSWFRDNAGEPTRRMWEIAHDLIVLFGVAYPAIVGFVLPKWVSAAENFVPLAGGVVFDRHRDARERDFGLDQ